MSDLYNKGEEERKRSAVKWEKEREAFNDLKIKSLLRLAKCGKIFNV